MTNLSRSGRTDPGGKLTKRLDIPIGEDLEEAVIALTALNGPGNKAEYGRGLIEESVFGMLNILRRNAMPSDRLTAAGAPSLDDAITAIAVVRGITADELSREILEAAVFGRMSMARRMAQTKGLSPSDEYPHTGARA